MMIIIPILFILLNVFTIHFVHFEQALCLLGKGKMESGESLIVVNVNSFPDFHVYVCHCRWLFSTMFYRTKQSSSSWFVVDCGSLIHSILLVATIDFLLPKYCAVNKNKDYNIPETHTHTRFNLSSFQAIYFRDRWHSIPFHFFLFWWMIHDFRVICMHGGIVEDHRSKNYTTRTNTIQTDYFSDAITVYKSNIFLIFVFV